MERDETIDAVAVQIDGLVGAGVVLPRAGLMLLMLLMQVVEDGQPAPLVVPNVNIGAIDVEWRIDGGKLVLSVMPDGVWSFWVQDADGDVEYEAEDRTGSMPGDIRTELQRRLVPIAGVPEQRDGTDR